MRTAATVVAMVIGLASLAAAGDETYRVNLSSPSHPGDVRSVSTKVTWKDAVKWTDAGTANKPTDERSTAELAGTETIDAVSTHGRATKLTIKVTRFTADGRQVLPAGATITAENVNAVTEFKVDGATPPDGEKRVLNEVVYAARPDEPTADAEWGTDQARKVGETWPVNGAALAEATHLPFHVGGEDFKGETKLEKVAVEDGRTVETLHMTHTCAFDERRATDGTTYKKLTMKYDLAETVPVDVGEHGSASKESRTVTMTVVDSRGTRDVSSERTREQTYASVKK